MEVTQKATSNSKEKKRIFNMNSTKVQKVKNVIFEREISKIVLFQKNVNLSHLHSKNLNLPFQ